jgi:hypothetical protein
MSPVSVNVCFEVQSEHRCLSSGYLFLTQAEIISLLALSI